LENFYLLRKLVSNYQKMSIILDVNNAVSLTLDLEALVIMSVDKITKILHAERASLFLLDEQTYELWSKVA
jgi:adenylate cyclase